MSINTSTFGSAVLSGSILEQVHLVGDALTVKLLNAGIHSRACSDRLLDTSGGILPSIGDFHGLMHTGDLVWRLVFHQDWIEENDPEKSPGTLANLAFVTGRKKKVKPLWKDDFAENERFLEDVVAAHVTGFAMVHFGMTSLTASPTMNKPDFVWTAASSQKKAAWLHAQCRRIVEGVWNWSEDLGASAQPPPRDLVSPRAPTTVERHTITPSISHISSMSATASTRVHPCLSRRRRLGR